MTLETETTPKPLSRTLTGSEKREYTATLHCKIHGNYPGTLRQFLGKCIATDCPRCREDLKQVQQDQERIKAAWLKQQKIEKLLHDAGLPKRFQKRSFANYQLIHSAQEQVLNIAHQYAQQFEDRLSQGGSLIFAGNPGTGKTHLAAAIAQYVIHSGRSVLFISVLHAIRRIKACYHKSSVQSEQAVLDGLIQPDLLILDEVGVQFGTETEQLILFEILNGRYEAVRPTLLISNLTEAELRRYVGVRVIDRLQEGGGAFLSFNWDSYRKQVHQDTNLPKHAVTPVTWSL